MDPMDAFDAILFPSDGRPPHLVSLMTSPMPVPIHHNGYANQPSRIPHPEVSDRHQKLKNLSTTRLYVRCTWTISQKASATGLGNIK